MAIKLGNECGDALSNRVERGVLTALAKQVSPVNSMLWGLDFMGGSRWIKVNVFSEAITHGFE